MHIWKTVPSYCCVAAHRWDCLHSCVCVCYNHRPGVWPFREDCLNSCARTSPLSTHFLNSFETVLRPTAVVVYVNCWHELLSSLGMKSCHPPHGQYWHLARHPAAQLLPRTLLSWQRTVSNPGLRVGTVQLPHGMACTLLTAWCFALTAT